MTIEEAKEILAVYRADLPVEGVEGASEALALLETDPELRAWFEAEQAFDDQFATALQDIAVPGDLQTRILEEASKEIALTNEPSEDKVVSFPRRRLWTIAAAAMVVTVASLVKYFMFPPPVVFPRTEFTKVTDFCEDMAFYANSRFVLAHQTKDLSEARDWLKEQSSPVYEETPDVIVEFEGMGCQTFNWDKHQVSLVCFKNREDDIVHLFVVNQSAFEELVPASQLNKMEVRHRLQTGGWMGDDKLFLLVGSDPKVEIEDLLADVVEA